MSQTLHPYQERATEVTIPEAFRKGNTSVLCVSPCGSGKTTMLARMAQKCLARNTSAVIAVHRRALVAQIAQRLLQWGLPYSVSMAEMPDAGWAVYRPGELIHVVSRNTALSRGVPTSGMLFVDEAHLIEGDGYARLRKAINPRWTLGLTATPCRADGSGFGPETYQAMVEVTRIEDLVAAGYLSRVDTYAPHGLGTRRRRGLPTGISGDPVQTWLQHAEGLRTVVFARQISECRGVVNMYLGRGITAEHINAQDPDELRAEAVQRLVDRVTKVLVVTPGLFGVGVDIPQLECVQSLVKNISPVAYWQSLGRAQRTHPDKSRAVLLDHSGAVYEHGMPNQSPAWSLGDRGSVQHRRQKQLEDPKEPRPVTCRACGLVSVGQSKCPECGSPLFVRHAQQPETEGDPLIAHDSVPQQHNTLTRTWRSILYSCAAQGTLCKVAAARYKTKTGCWPDERVDPPYHVSMGMVPVATQFPMFVKVKA